MATPLPGSSISATLKDLEQALKSKDWTKDCRAIETAIRAAELAFDNAVIDDGGAPLSVEDLLRLVKIRNSMVNCEVGIRIFGKNAAGVNDRVNNELSILAENGGTDLRTAAGQNGLRQLQVVEKLLEVKKEIGNAKHVNPGPSMINVNMILVNHLDFLWCLGADAWPAVEAVKFLALGVNLSDSLSEKHHPNLTLIISAALMSSLMNLEEVMELAVHLRSSLPTNPRNRHYALQTIVTQTLSSLKEQKVRETSAVRGLI